MDFPCLLSISRVGFWQGLSIVLLPSDLICLKSMNNCIREFRQNRKFADQIHAVATDLVGKSIRPPGELVTAAPSSGMKTRHHSGTASLPPCCRASHVFFPIRRRCFLRVVVDDEAS